MQENADKLNTLSALRALLVDQLAAVDTAMGVLTEGYEHDLEIVSERDAALAQLAQINQSAP